MFTTIVLLIFAAVAAYAGYAWLCSRREARALGRSMGVQYRGHVALNRRRLSGGGAGVMPEPHAAGSYEAAGPSALDLLYAQMAEQEEGYRRRERERERGY
jgi:hypothetical protein